MANVDGGADLWVSASTDGAGLARLWWRTGLLVRREFANGWPRLIDQAITLTMRPAKEQCQPREDTPLRTPRLPSP